MNKHDKPHKLKADKLQRPGAIDPRALRDTLGQFVTGVTIVTTRAPDGTPRGFTANSFTSVSLDPPLVLVCIAHKAISFPIFNQASHFAINILTHEQIELAGIFATKSPDKFSSVTWRGAATGSPILPDLAGWLDCDRHQVVDAGDHAILIGRIVAFEHGEAAPLAYHRGRYMALDLEAGSVRAIEQIARISARLGDGPSRKD